MLSVIMLSGIMQSGNMLSGITLSDIMLSGIMLTFIMQCVTYEGLIDLCRSSMSDFMPNVFMLSDFKLSGIVAL
jgi:hypothetical protein